MVPAPEALHRRALATLTAAGDEASRAILAGATLSVDPQARTWQGSAGTIRAHRVVLGVDLAAWCEVRTRPALYDALGAALAAAFTLEGNETLHELGVFWDGRGAAEEVPYRGVVGHAHQGRGDPASVRAALVAALQALGHAELAALAESVSLTLEPSAGAATRVTLGASKDVLKQLRGPAGRGDAVVATLRALLTGPAGEPAAVALRAERPAGR